MQHLCVRCVHVGSSLRQYTQSDAVLQSSEESFLTEGEERLSGGEAQRGKRGWEVGVQPL